MRARSPAVLCWALAGAMLAAPALASGAAPAAAARPSQQASAGSDLLQSVRDLERCGDLRAAAAKLQAAVALAPDWALPRALLGRVWQLLGHQQDALRQYQAHQFIALLQDNAEQDNHRMLAIAEAEGLIVLRINQERISRGLPPLLPSVELSQIARQHSREMRDLGYFGHSSPKPGYATITDRYRRVFGTTPRALAENVSRRGGSGQAFVIENIEDTHRRLMMSEPHRQSILWEKVRIVGVGIAVNQRNDYWLTENFASDVGGDS